MSLRSRTGSPSEGEVLSGDEEKAISTHASRDRDGMVNTSARPYGSSSRASRFSHGLGGRFGDLSADKNFHFRDEDDEISVRRARDRSRSPFRANRSRSRSPYRAAKTSGEKRRRDDDHYAARTGSDQRRHRIHYEDRPGSRDGSAYRNHRSYAETDRSRDRSRSPYRPGKMEAFADSRNGSRTAGCCEDRNGPQSAVSNHEQGRDADETQESVFSFKICCALTDLCCRSATSRNADGSAADKGEQQPKLSEAELIEQRRKRREAIKARHKPGANQGLLVQALEHNITSAPATPAHDSSGVATEQGSPDSSLNSPKTPRLDSPPQSPATFTVNDDEELANRRVSDSAVQEDEGPSAADYDPNMDFREDRPDHKRSGVEAPIANITQGAPETAPKPSKEFDMFADDDDDDMFAPTDSVAKPAGATNQAKTLDESLLDNWDYPDGHYRIILGELLDNRYAIKQQVGKGTFATVVRAQDTKTGSDVAIKIAANNETMYKAGTKEMDFVRLLNDSDPDDKKHVIRLLRNFDHKGHMCIVFEALSADLREVLKKFGRNVGLNLKAIRSYAQQMFLALSHMKKCSILHADLKPDNILVSERRNLLKICDLGTAAFVTDTELTPYLVSRFYRAPEVILGMPFDYAIDMWSIGCTLFELYTGRILFAGADNNQMLRAIQECRGKIPIRMLKQSHPDQRDRHFDFENNFHSQERDKLSGKAVVRQINFKSSGEPGKDLKSRLANNAKGLAPAELKEHLAFVDLLEKCLQLDPARRISPNDALRHGFIAHGGQPPPAEKERAKVVPAMGVGVGAPRAR